MDRVGLGDQPGDQGMADLVVGGHPLDLAGDDLLALGPHQDLVAGRVEVGHVDLVLVLARGQQGGLVDEVGEVGAGHPHGPPRDPVEVDVLGQGDVPGVDLEDLQAALLGRPVDGDVAVEPAGAEEGGVEDVGPVGGGQDDHALVGGEAVHLGEDLVERLLALVMPPSEPRAPDSADGVDLVDEQDAGAVLLGRLEHVADPAGPDPDEHLDELGARDREERDGGLPRDRAGQERLAGARRAVEQDPLGDAPAEPLELLGALEELDDLLELALGVLQARDLLEGGPLLGLVVPLGLALGEGPEDAAVELVAGPAHHQVDQQDEPQGRQQEREPEQAAGALGGHPLDPGGLVLLEHGLPLGVHDLLAGRVEQFAALQLLDDEGDHLLGGEGGRELRDLGDRGERGRRGIRHRLPELAVDQQALVHQGLDVVGADLLHEPRAEVDRGLILAR